MRSCDSEEKRKFMTAEGPSYQGTHFCSRERLTTAVQRDENHPERSRQPRFPPTACSLAGTCTRPLGRRWGAHRLVLRLRLCSLTPRPATLTPRGSWRGTESRTVPPGRSLSPRFRGRVKYSSSLERGRKVTRLLS